MLYCVERESKNKSKKNVWWKKRNDINLSRQVKKPVNYFSKSYLTIQMILYHIFYIIFLLKNIVYYLFFYGINITVYYGGQKILNDQILAYQKMSM
jgi:hypothetical protein